MRPIEILEREHRVIEQVLDCVEKMGEIATKQRHIEAGPARQALDFLRTFADGCHHAKEEQRLFPLMESKGFASEAGPTAVMRHEHELGRALIGRMEAAIEGDQVSEFVEASSSYVELLRQHIRKEDHCLFPMAEQALGGEDQQALLRSFAQVDPAERCLRLADELAERYGVARRSGGAELGLDLDAQLLEESGR